MKTITTNWRYWLNLFIATIISLVLIFGGLTIWFSYQRAQSYLHPLRHYATAELLKENNIPYQFVKLKTKDGLKLAAWYTPPQNGAVILVAHGYGDKRPEDFYALFAQHGYGVLAWDFRAHGNSEGDFSTLGYYEQRDVEAALNFALAQPDVRHVGAWGGSMGGATVILTAAKRTEIEAVVSDSAYPTLEDVLKLNISIEFMQPFVLFFGEWSSGADVDQVRPVDEIAKISPRAVYIIDGSEGAMRSPYWLYEAAGEPKFLWTEPGVPHLNMYVYYRERYTKRVIRFFDQYLLKK